MRAVVQRVANANVTIGGKIKSQINSGLLILLGIEDRDTHEEIDWLCGKISRLRIFDDSEGVMNSSVKDIKGELLVVSQFTLYANTKKGNRPSYIRASKPDFAIPMYEKFVETLSTICVQEVKTGLFGAMMQVNLVNDGPVTIIIDTKDKDF
jgi:D-tyrosyl-tRNA(Tyr) deacylase